jgi:hypothetical protein
LLPIWVAFWVQIRKIDMSRAIVGLGLPFWLRVLSALFAFAAAGFWMASAWGELPEITIPWGSMPADHPFVQALAHSATMNRFAAGAAGISALFAAGAEVMTALHGRHKISK